MQATQVESTTSMSRAPREYVQCARPKLVRDVVVCGLLFMMAFVWASPLTSEARAADPSLQLVDGKLTVMPKRAPRGRAGANAIQLDALGKQLANRLSGGQRLTRGELATWLRSEGNSLSRLLQATGLDPDAVIAEAIDDDQPAAGGPFVAVDLENAAFIEDPLSGAIERVIAQVPVAAPIDRFKVNSRFGKRIDPFRKRWAFHRGIDLGAPRGTVIRATADGHVVKAGRMGGYGNIVIIDHGHGVETYYAHLARYDVRAGAEVTAGQRIGLIGRTGRSTGIHLHYEVRVNDRPLDPARFMNVGAELARNN